MKYSEYIEAKNKLKNKIQSGILAQKELSKAKYMRTKIKLNKIIRRGKRAEDKLRAGAIL